MFKEGVDSIEKISLLLTSFNPKSQLENGKKLSKKFLVNSLNYVNFQDDTILINLKHIKYGSIVSLQAKPQPCLENTLDCLWVRTEGIAQKLSSYRFLNFLINNGQKMILVKADVKEISKERISLNLPETCYEISLRQIKRHPCEGIRVELLQNGVLFPGILRDFSPVSFSIEISADPPLSFQLINPESTVHIIFKNKGGVFYSGACKIIRQTLGQKIRTLVLEPVNDKLCRFKHKEYRSLRHKLSPSPTVIFVHPLTGKTVTLEVIDLSGSGFSVEEYAMNSVLLPGMIIPDLFIEIAHDFRIRCKAQVVYRSVYQTYENEMYAKCGIAILDMDIQNQVRLSSLLHHVTNRNSYVCGTVDLDALWEFFFRAGTIYPQRYAFIHANKEKFRETYEKLYIHSPAIARHFIYQDRGIIQGHISVLHFYENTWLIHQLASGAIYNKAGLVVLDQIARYINDFYSLYSTHMSFIVCYFRQTTKFSNRVFKGFTDYLNKPKGCSIDLLAYFHFSESLEQELPREWTLSSIQPDDLFELQGFYEHNSGGLMLHALDLEPGMIDSTDLNQEYQRFGFKRQRRIFSLKKDGLLKAIIMVTVSDIGLDMSNLTNCIHVIILDAEDLTRNILYASLSHLSQYYEQARIPVLIYPLNYAESQSIACEKIYNLWTISTQYTDHYLRYMENLIIKQVHGKQN
jgi:hypothetical protein